MERQESSIGDDMFKYVNRPDLTDDERDLLQNTIELAVKLHFEEVKIPESQSEEILTEKELIERETQSLAAGNESLLERHLPYIIDVLKLKIQRIQELFEKCQNPTTFTLSSTNNKVKGQITLQSPYITSGEISFQATNSTINHTIDNYLMEQLLEFSNCLVRLKKKLDELKTILINKNLSTINKMLEEINNLLNLAHSHVFASNPQSFPSVYYDHFNDFIPKLLNQVVIDISIYHGQIKLSYFKLTPESNNKTPRQEVEMNETYKKRNKNSIQYSVSKELVVLINIPVFEEIGQSIFECIESCQLLKSSVKVR